MVSIMRCMCKSHVGQALYSKGGEDGTRLCGKGWLDPALQDEKKYDLAATFVDKS